VYVAHAQRAAAASEDSDPDAGAAFVRGHLALLFGLLVRGAPAGRTVLLAALPGVSARAKLARLAEDARAFVAFYAALADAGGAERPRGQAGVFGEDGGGVAARTLAFLETLRDEA
jgi:hypothetical protein